MDISEFKIELADSTKQFFGWTSHTNRNKLSWYYSLQTWVEIEIGRLEKEKKEREEMKS